MEQGIEVEVGSYWIKKSDESLQIVEDVGVGSDLETYVSTKNINTDLNETYSRCTRIDKFLLNNTRLLTVNEVIIKMHKKDCETRSKYWVEGFNHAKDFGLLPDHEETETLVENAYQKGCEQAYSELHAPTSERERQLQEKAWDEGYKEGEADMLETVNELSAQQADDYNNGDSISVKDFGVEGYTVERYPVTDGIDVIEFIKNNYSNIKSYTQVGDVCSIEMFDTICTEQTRDKKEDNDWKTTRCPDEGSEGYLKDYNIEAIREDKKHKYPHYFKDVSHLDWIDVYQVNKLFPVKDDTDCILHARKKLLVCGGRGGGKDMLKDIKEAYDTLHRYLEIEGHLDD